LTRYVRVYRHDGKVYRNEIDGDGRMIVGKVGNLKCIHRKMVKKIDGEQDVRDFYRIITGMPIDKVEFYEE
jgi:hypothetical protein